MAVDHDTRPCRKSTSLVLHSTCLLVARSSVQTDVQAGERWTGGRVCLLQSPNARGMRRPTGKMTRRVARTTRRTVTLETAPRMARMLARLMRAPPLTRSTLLCHLVTQGEQHRPTGSFGQ